MNKTDNIVLEGAPVINVDIDVRKETLEESIYNSRKEVEERYRNGEPLITRNIQENTWYYVNMAYNEFPEFEFYWDRNDYATIREDEISEFTPLFTEASSVKGIISSRRAEDKMVKTENNLQKVNKKIEEIYEGMKDLNIYKNTQYGNIGSEPLNLFAKYMSKETPALNGIYQRLDDKLSRVKNCPDERPRVNDVCDIMGYLNLLLVNMGVTKEDIEKFKD